MGKKLFYRVLASNRGSRRPDLSKLCYNQPKKSCRPLSLEWGAGALKVIEIILLKIFFLYSRFHIMFLSTNIIYIFLLSLLQKYILMRSFFLILHQQSYYYYYIYYFSVTTICTGPRKPSPIQIR